MTGFIAIIIMAFVYGVNKFLDVTVDSSMKEEAGVQAVKDHKAIFESKGRYYSTKTWKEVHRSWNSKTNCYEYTDEKNKVVHSEIEDWRAEQEDWSKYKWNSVFQWDKTSYSNQGEVKGIRYKDKFTGHLLVLTTMYVGEKKCKVYIDLDTMTYIRRSDGEINREMRYKRFYPEENHSIDEEALNKRLLESTEDLRKAVGMNKYDPKKGYAMLGHSGEYTSDWEEAKMPWLGEQENLKLLEKNFIYEETNNE